MKITRSELLYIYTFAVFVLISAIGVAAIISVIAFNLVVYGDLPCCQQVNCINYGNYEEPRNDSEDYTK